MNDKSIDDISPSQPPPGRVRAFCGNHPVLIVLAFAIFGIALGIGLSAWDSDGTDKTNTLQWIGLIGDLFIRSLKAIVLPLVFISVVLSVVDMMTIGRASSVGWKTIVVYLMTTLIAAVVAVIAIVSFKGLFEKGAVQETEEVQVTLGCLGNEAGTFLSQLVDGSVQCVAPDATLEEPDPSTLFSFTDVSGTLSTEDSSVDNDISLSDTLYDGIFLKLVTDNIFFSFNEASFAAVVFFAIFFGVALSQHITGSGLTLETSSLMGVLKECEGTLIKLIDWVIMATPIAVLSLVAKALGDQDNLKDSFANVGYLMLATMVANLAHVLIIHLGLLSLVLRQNPLNYLKHLTEAQSLALACSSSAATVPMTLKCVMKSGYVPTSVAKFVVPLGATMNMDGGAIYFPCACVWLAVLNGLSPGAADYILLVIIATIGSAGTAPVPSASLVLVITAYNTVFNGTGTPAGFEFILAIDWFMDRIRTVLNVTGDCTVSAIVARWAHMDELETSDVGSGKVASGKYIDDSDTDATVATKKPVAVVAATPE